MEKASLPHLRRDIKAAADPKRAKANRRYFRTAKGEYGEGDLFIGLTVPECRRIAGTYRDLELENVEKLLHSRFHEERLVAFLILVDKFERASGDGKEQKKIFEFYMEHADSANNWDLVYLTAPKIVGVHLLDKPTKLLDGLARSKDLWRRRIGICATYAFIKDDKLGETFRVADLLLDDEHDLIHKATGWMLREAGKRDKKALVAWLKPRYRRMPRTMLRYAIERFPERERQAYLKGTA